MKTRFIEQIVKTRCGFTDWVKNYHSQEVILFGTGEGGENIYRYLQTVGIAVTHIVENRAYFTPKIFMNRNVEILEEVLECANRKVDLIVQITGYNPSMIKEYEFKINKILFYDLTPALIPDRGNLSITSYEFWKEQSDVMDKIYTSMEDEFSKKSLVSYVNQRISGDYSYAENIIRLPQYFDDELIRFSDNEVFIDCGAFDGEDTVEFLKRTRGTQRQALICEADTDNCTVIAKKLCNGGNLQRNCSLIQKAVWSNDGKLKFSFGEADESRVSETGDGEVECTKIDTICNEMDVIPTFIKMDIEGAELEALKGAENIIRGYKPRLAVCIYHHPEDLVKIWSYIKELRSDYKFGLRRYSRSYRETVLFAI